MTLTFREAQPKDMPQLLSLHAEQNRRDRTRYPLAEIFDEQGRQRGHIPLALVLCREDEVLGAIVFEAKGLEMMVVGCNPRVTIIAEHAQNSILYALRSMGFRWIRTLIPKSVVKLLAKPMKAAGFRRDDGRFATFFREI